MKLVGRGQQQFGEAEYLGECVVEVVGHTAGHSAQGMQAFLFHDLLLRLAQFRQAAFQAAVGFPQGLFRVFALGDVLEGQHRPHNRIAFMHRHAGVLNRNGRTVLAPKDFIIHRLRQTIAQRGTKRAVLFRERRSVHATVMDGFVQ